MTTNILYPPLFDKIRNYLVKADINDQIIFFVPFIKTIILEKLIEGLENKIIIITDFSKRNLISGSSELKLYPYCKERKIALYHNEKIHLKVYSKNLGDMILATGNISQRGLMPDGNLEMGIQTLLNNEERLFLEKIRKNSIKIDDEIYEELLQWSKINPIRHLPEEKFPNPKKSIDKDEFLISALPMTKSVNVLIESYTRLNQGNTASDDKETNDCVFHDLANYDIQLNLELNEFQKALKSNFFRHPFIQKIDQFLNPSGHFGEIKEWVQKNCTDVPIPSRRELTGNIQVLFEWFEKLGEGKYRIDVPGSHSQRLTKINKNT